MRRPACAPRSQRSADSSRAASHPDAIQSTYGPSPSYSAECLCTIYWDPAASSYIRPLPAPGRYCFSFECTSQGPHRSPYNCPRETALRTRLQVVALTNCPLFHYLRLAHNTRTFRREVIASTTIPYTHTTQIFPVKVVTLPEDTALPTPVSNLPPLRTLIALRSDIHSHP